MGEMSEGAVRMDTAERSGKAGAGSRDAGRRFERLVDLVARLRSPEGCPWDRSQTHSTLRRYVLEEAYEVAEAIDAGDPRNLCEELGDLLLQVLLHCQIAQEEGNFGVEDCLDGLAEKLVRRHPHVFGRERVEDSSAAQRRWEEMKAAERRAREGPVAEKGWLDSVPSARPALETARQLGSKAAEAGFDWSAPEPVFNKIREELAELESALKTPPSETEAGHSEILEEELGDLLFAVVNLARRLDLDPEAALARANRKFRTRFKYIEENLIKRGKRLQDASLEEMEALWEESKNFA